MINLSAYVFLVGGSEKYIDLYTFDELRKNRNRFSCHSLVQLKIPLKLDSDLFKKYLGAKILKNQCPVE